MTLTRISSRESARKKIFMKSTYIMSRKEKQTFLGQETEMTLTPISSLESARKNFS